MAGYFSYSLLPTNGHLLPFLWSVATTPFAAHAEHCLRQLEPAVGLEVLTVLYRLTNSVSDERPRLICVFSTGGRILHGKTESFAPDRNALKVIVRLYPETPFLSATVITSLAACIR